MKKAQARIVSIERGICTLDLWNRAMPVGPSYKLVSADGTSVLPLAHDDFRGGGIRHH